MPIETQLYKRQICFGLILVSISAGFSFAQKISGPPNGKPIQPIKALVKVEHEIKNRPIEKASRGYISSSSCRQCHAHHYDTWHASHHRTMTQVPTQETVIADFDNKVLVHSGREFLMEVKRSRGSDSDSASKGKTFKIVLMTGAHHQQGFWCETDKARTLGKIPFIWINKEQRWVPYGSIFFLPSSPLSMHAGVWNSNCIKCHVVGGQQVPCGWWSAAIGSKERFRHPRR